MSSEQRQPDTESHDQCGIEFALKAVGAWADVDFDEMLHALDRIRHESTPTLPIDLDV